MQMRVLPFTDEFIPQAADLLAQRHQRDRILLPELPHRFEEPSVAQQAIEAALQRPHASGFAALQEDRLLAYLIGDMMINNLWGRSGWIRSPGCAYDPAFGVESVRDLYAALGARWVSYGVFFHFALIPVSDPDLIHAWFSLSFGMEQVHALLDLQSLVPALPSLPDDLEIRKAGKEDRRLLAEMSDVIWKAQVKAPIWGVMMPESIGENVEGWAELVDDNKVAVWLAINEGTAVGTQGYWPVEPTAENLMLSDDCVHMSVAGTRAEMRGQGIATLLTQQGLAQAKNAGYRFCETDWRSTNLAASRCWPRQGFRPVFYRLVRRIDSRIAWANGVVPN